MYAADADGDEALPVSERGARDGSASVANDGPMDFDGLVSGSVAGAKGWTAARGNARATESAGEGEERIDGSPRESARTLRRRI